MRHIIILLLVSWSALVSAQVVTLQPTFVTQNDTVTVLFNAKEGNGELVGVSQVYAHTGVITNLSSSGSDWRHVQGNWGTADNKVKMTALGNDLHEIKYHINSFYNVPGNETVTSLAFVFRNADGTKVGRAADGSDIFVDLYQGGFAAKFTSPDDNGIIALLTDSFNVKAEASESSSIQISVDGMLVNQNTSTKNLSTPIKVSNYGTGKHYITMLADNGTQTIVDTFYYIVNPPVSIQNPQPGIEDGINYLNDTSVVLQLVAPFKNFIYVVGDFNGWEYDEKYFMKKVSSGDRWWIQINGLTPGKKYRFQYSIDNEAMRVAEIYAEQMLDPWNDKWIDAATNNDFPSYPEGKTTNVVSILQTAEVPFNWDTTYTYNRPKKENLVVYELLVRDFTEKHSYQSLIDSMNYFIKMGVNAIELMPIMEFEGNESWGYNPAFYFAPDKYYGPKDDFKRFVETCHKNNIAVILDIALNHSFGLNPQVRMYFDPSAGQWGQPTSNSPWFNQVEKHPFNVGYDYNHLSAYTKSFCKRVISHWIEEFRIDGYRFDLSKGFTQTDYGSNVALWGQYDQGRIDILKEYADHQWSVDSTSYLILEHFADNSEETVLANYGMMVWGNMHHDYKEASLGYSTDLSWGLKDSRGWNDHHLITYGVSHDEERLMVENYLYGNQNTGYDLRDTVTALARQELIAVFLMAVPGPKMFWQFDELGYDYSINFNGRTGNKPVRWDYFKENRRYRVRQAYGAMANLKTKYPTFSTNNYKVKISGYEKKIHLDHPDMNATILGNFKMDLANIDPEFQHTGWWYNYFSGDSILVNNINDPIELFPGQYRVFTDKKLPEVNLNKPGYVFVENQSSSFNAIAFPNPVMEQLTIKIQLQNTENVSIKLLDLNGRLIDNIYNGFLSEGEHQLNWTMGSDLNTAPGVYLIQFKGQDFQKTEKIVVGK